MDIEAVIVIVIQTINQIGKFNRRITGKVNRRFQIYQKCCHPAFAKHGVREMMKGFPWSHLTTGPFRNEHVNMGIPFQVTPKRVENTDHTKLELLLLVQRQSPVVNDLRGRTKEDIEKIAVSSEIWAELIRDGKNNMTMSAIDELFFHRGSTVILISGAAGIAETGVTSEGNETDPLAARTLVESKSHFRVTTRENPVDLIDDDRSDIWCFFKEGIPMVF